MFSCCQGRQSLAGRGEGAKEELAARHASGRGRNFTELTRVDFAILFKTTLATVSFRIEIRIVGLFQISLLT